MSYIKKTLSNKSLSFSVSGSLRRLLSKQCKEYTDTIAIENAFKETSRDGKAVLRFVRLALTARALVIAYEKERVTPYNVESCEVCAEKSLDLITLYPWKAVKLSVFKKSERSCIKVLFLDKTARYFELRGIPKMKIYWDLWRRYIRELNAAKKIWPFTDKFNDPSKRTDNETHGIEICVEKPKTQKFPRKWTDKHLYLGSLRAIEDQNRPCPVPGLGRTEEIKLLYLNPEYFGCWEQSEHWVQCRESSSDFASQNSDCTGGQIKSELNTSVG